MPLLRVKVGQILSATSGGRQRQSWKQDLIHARDGMLWIVRLIIAICTEWRYTVMRSMNESKTSKKQNSACKTPSPSFGQSLVQQHHRVLHAGGKILARKHSGLMFNVI
jgi:hypothetical protein